MSSTLMALHAAARIQGVFRTLKKAKLARRGRSAAAAKRGFREEDIVLRRLTQRAALDKDRRMVAEQSRLAREWLAKNRRNTSTLSRRRVAATLTRDRQPLPQASRVGCRSAFHTPDEEEDHCNAARRWLRARRTMRNVGTATGSHAPAAGAEPAPERDTSRRATPSRADDAYARGSSGGAPQQDSFWVVLARGLGLIAS